MFQLAFSSWRRLSFLLRRFEGAGNFNDPILILISTYSMENPLQSANLEGIETQIKGHFGPSWPMLIHIDPWNFLPCSACKRANFVLAPSQRQSIIAWESVHIVAELVGEPVPGQTTVGYRIIRDCGSTAYLSVSKTVSCRHVHQEECSPPPPGVSKGSSLTGLLASKRPRAGFFPAHRVGAKKTTILIQT